MDHLCWLVDDGETTREALARQEGLGSERGMYYDRAGTQHWNVPLCPPSYVEILEIVNRQDAERGDVGPETLAAEARGGGLFSWAVLVDDLEGVSERLGIAIDDYTLEQPDGTLRGWRTVSGPCHLPFFIDYPNNPGRPGRMAEMLSRVGHSNATSSVATLVIEGEEQAMNAWIGPHAIPMRFVPGDQGLLAAELATPHGLVTLPPPGLTARS